MNKIKLLGALCISIAFVGLITNQLALNYQLKIHRIKIQLLEQRIDSLSNITTIVQPELNDTLLYQFIVDCNIKHPHIVFAQAKMESNCGKSELFKKSNNLFGMRCAKARPNTYIGETSSGFAIYNDWKDSVLDYALLQSHYYRNKTEEEYYTIIENNFAETIGYSEKIKLIANKWKH